MTGNQGASATASHKQNTNDRGPRSRQQHHGHSPGLEYMDDTSSMREGSNGGVDGVASVTGSV